MEVGELLELLGDRDDLGGLGGRLRLADSCCRGLTGLAPDAVVLAVLVLLHLPVDGVLHLHRVGDVGEVLTGLLTGGLDTEVAGVEDALEQVLGEEHRVDAVERDLDAGLVEDAGTVDAAFGRDDEVGRSPPDEADDERAERDHHQRGRDVLDRLFEVGIGVEVVGQREDAGSAGQHQEEGPRREVPPMGVTVEDDRLVVVQVLLGECHVVKASDASAAKL